MKDTRMLNCLSTLIDITLEKSKIIESVNPEMDFSLHWREFRTVCMSSCRRAGHSTTIADVIKFKDLKNVAILFPSLEQHHVVKNELKDRKDIFYFSPNCIDRVRGRSLSCLFVDQAYAISNKKMKEVLQAIMPAMVDNPDYFIAMLQ